MKQRLYRLDFWVIIACEWFSHWWQKRLGIRAVFFERLFLLGAAAMLACSGLAAWFTVLPEFVLGSMLAQTSRFGRQRRQLFFMNPAKIEERWPRLLLLLWCPHYLVAWPWLLWPAYWYLFFVAAIYFRACDDLPPGESRLRRWWRAVTAQRITIPARQT